MGSKKVYSEVEKEKILCELSFTTIKETAQKYGVSRNTITRWKKSFWGFKGTKVYSEEEKQKILGEFFNVSLNSSFAVKYICKKYNISRFALYSWRKDFKQLDCKEEFRKNVVKYYNLCLSKFDKHTAFFLTSRKYTGVKYRTLQKWRKKYGDKMPVYLYFQHEFNAK